VNKSQIYTRLSKNYSLEAQAPRVNGCLASMDASCQWTPRVKEHAK